MGHRFAPYFQQRHCQGPGGHPLSTCAVTILASSVYLCVSLGAQVWRPLWTSSYVVLGHGLAWWGCLRWHREAFEWLRQRAKHPSGYCCGVRVDHAGDSGQMLKILPSNQTVDQVEVRGDQQKCGGEDESSDFLLFLWREKL